MENNLYINLRDIDQLKAFYAKTTEEMMIILLDNEDKLSCRCPSYCELKEFFENILK